MPDLREVFEIVTKQTEPDLDAWIEQEQRQQRSARNRKMRALVVAAAITVGIVLLATGVLNRGRDRSAPATVVPSASQVALTAVDLDGTIRSLMLDLPDGAAMPDVSPDGLQVAFTVFDLRSETTEGRVSQVAVMNLDGTGLHILTSGRNSSVEWPRWSPDGSRLLFFRILSYRSQQTNGLGYRRLMVMNADGTDAHVIRGVRSPDSQPPAWSPDGRDVLYTSVAGSSQHLEAIPVTGGHSQTMRTSPHAESEATWSPDGTSIAFVRQVSHDVSTVGITVSLRYEIWLMNADGSNRRPLAAIPDVNAEAPEWSPDGGTIAFIGSMFGIGGGESDSDAVYVVNIATGEIMQVLKGIAVGTGHDSRATWLPDGDALLVMTKTP